MDLFEYMRSTNMEKEAPLAARMRPRTLDEVVGQEHIIGKDKLLYRAIKADKISSIIFYGPPGTGKTTLAKVIANTTSAEFQQINATVAGKKDMEEVVAKAKELQGMYRKRTILFIDEIHRFNKGQQDYLLPYVEDGTIILIGATTENPYFEVNGALISRSVIFELKPIPREAIKELLKKAVYDTDRGMGAYNGTIDEDALDFLADISGGDARHALNAIELGIMSDHIARVVLVCSSQTLYAELQFLIDQVILSVCGSGETGFYIFLRQIRLQIDRVIEHFPDPGASCPVKIFLHIGRKHIHRIFILYHGGNGGFQESLFIFIAERIQDLRLSISVLVICWEVSLA